MKREQEIYTLQSKCATQEAQIANQKRERDRLLEVSKNLRISLNKLEKQQALGSIKLVDDVGAGLGPDSRSMLSQRS